MKWVMLLLLLLNGLYFTLQFNSSPIVDEVEQRSPFEGKDLVLLAEKEGADEAKKRVEQSINARLSVLQDKQELTPEKKEPEKIAAKLIVKPEPQPVVKLKEKPAQLVVKAPVQTKPESKPKFESKPKVESRPEPANGARLSLAKACYTVGPFLLMSDVASAASIFDRAGIYAEQRSKAQRKQVGYWAYVPPLASADKAAAALKKIKDSGVSDVQVILSGNKANALSAGVYQAVARAEKRRQLIAALGYSVKVEPLYRTQPQYWLDVELMQSTKLSSRLWKELSDSRPNIRQERRKCN